VECGFNIGEACRFDLRNIDQDLAVAAPVSHHQSGERPCQKALLPFH
jgi:hypothetical protein